VRKEITPIFGKRKVVLMETKRAVTPFGGLSIFAEFLGRIGYRAAVAETMPFVLKSPNAISPDETFTAFLISVAAGARRFAHTGLLRADKALHSIMGIKRFPTDDTIRNLFKRFTMGDVYRFFSPLWEWQIRRLPGMSSGYSLDLDSTVFERYGNQEGAVKGYNPKRPGRHSHHPLLAVLGEAYFILNGWLRSGNAGTSRGVVEFLKESLAMLGGKHKIRVVRADSGFFGQDLLEFLEERGLQYIIVARMTRWLKHEAAGVTQWKDLDETCCVGEFHKELFNWKRSRRFVVVRERIRENQRSAGRRLLDVPGYTFRIFVTNCGDSPEVIWRDYNNRADMENRIAELKYDLAADDFCMRQFFATEAAFRSVLLLFNLLSEFQRATGMTSYRRPVSLRSGVFLCGAILGRSGNRQILHMSEAWGGLKRRIPLIDKILSYRIPTSPKLEFEMRS
jgi:hypothetical protein